MAPRLIVFTFAEADGFPRATLNKTLRATMAQWEVSGDDMPMTHQTLERTYGGWKAAATALRHEHPDWCLLLDMDPESSEYKIHVFAANLDDDARADAAGAVRTDHIIDPDGPVAYRTRLPQDGLWDKFLVEGVPVRMSHVASHVFNHTLYRLLQVIQNEQLPVRLGALETPPIEPMPDAAGTPRTPAEATEELYMVLAVLRQLHAAIPEPDQDEKA